MINPVLAVWLPVNPSPDKLSPFIILLHSQAIVLAAITKGIPDRRWRISSCRPNCDIHKPLWVLVALENYRMTVWLLLANLWSLPGSKLLLKQSHLQPVSQDPVQIAF